MRAQQSATSGASRTARASRRQSGPKYRQWCVEQLCDEMDRIRRDWTTTTIEFVSGAELLERWREAMGADATRQPAGVVVAHAWRRDALNTRVLLSRDVLLYGQADNIWHMGHALMLMNGFANLSPLDGPRWSALLVDEWPSVAVVRHERYVRTSDWDARRIPPAVTFWPEHGVQARQIPA